MNTKIIYFALVEGLMLIATILAYGEVDISDSISRSSSTRRSRNKGSPSLAKPYNDDLNQPNSANNDESSSYAIPTQEYNQPDYSNTRKNLNGQRRGERKNEGKRKPKGGRRREYIRKNQLESSNNGLSRKGSKEHPKINPEQTVITKSTPKILPGPTVTETTPEIGSGSTREKTHTSKLSETATEFSGIELTTQRYLPLHRPNSGYESRASINKGQKIQYVGAYIKNLSSRLRIASQTVPKALPLKHSSTKIKEIWKRPSTAVLSSGFSFGSNSKSYRKKGLLGHLVSVENEGLVQTKPPKHNQEHLHVHAQNNDGAGIPKALNPIMPKATTPKTSELTNTLTEPSSVSLTTSRHHIHYGNFHNSITQPEFRGKCRKPIKPDHSSMDCDFTTEGAICRVQCYEGYSFTDNAERKESMCWNIAGIWNPSRNFPPCFPQCGDKCLNGGSCKSPGVCLCDAEYRGERCEYHISECNIHKLASENDHKINWACRHNRNETVCSVKCLPGRYFLEGPQLREHRCSIDGVWTPDEMPACVLDILKCDIRNLAGENANKFEWICQDTSSDTICTVKCPPGSQFSGGQQSEVYRCSADGTWTPNVMSTCVTSDV